MPGTPVKKNIDAHERVRNAVRNSLQVITKAITWRKQKYCHMSEETHKREALENIKATSTVKVKQNQNCLVFGKNNESVNYFHPFMITTFLHLIIFCS